MLNNFKVGHRLGAAFGLMLAMLVAMTTFALVSAGRLNANTEYFATNLVPSIRLAARMNELARTARSNETQTLIAADAAERDRLIDVMRARKADMLKMLDDYRAHLSDDTERALYDTARAEFDRYWPIQDKVVALGLTDPAAARQLHLSAGHDQFGKARDALGALADYNVKLGDARAVASAEGYHDVRLTLIGALVVCIGIGLGATVVITRSITRPLDEAVAVADRVADGDLSAAPHVERRDELGHLLDTLARMTERLAGVVREVRDSTDAVAGASREIATGNADLSARTEAQAASLQQTAASTEEMAGTVRASADNARQAESLANGTTDAAVRGGSAVERVVETMNGISESSRRIADIIGTIDGIAFQTNILALNAAVEAARAGEQGRGFAVVASEVRALAQRSAEAAREIKTLILDSNGRVEAGTNIVAEAGRTIGDVVTQVRRMNDLVSEISSASGEQDTGIGQINLAVSQLDHATQQNAALVEQTASAAESLKHQAARLAEVMSGFRLGAR
ncbi:methyl-accepting chemotaxis protein [Derxia gummosa]|uniref:Methyl-accepting chemotaxis protein n=1 Tax=Derxia gummosa DSM 723 TaxID=1121388 RepID=A0A8B6X4X2_9BURK|nr:methyl-accepting chemotaxis protein [Derxia gummosa]